LALIFSLLFLAPYLDWFPWLPWGGDTVISMLLKYISIITALMVVLYTGFLMAASPSIPFWNTAVLPIIFLVCSLAGGISVIFISLPFFPIARINVAFLELIEIFLLISALFIISANLITMNDGSITTKESVRLLTVGELTPHFFGGVMIGGLIIPLVIGIYSYFSGIELYFLVLGGMLDVTGAFFLRYSYIKAGVYRPVL
jgi:formate-dependent nitrite reductase membrane component NrfD